MITANGPEKTPYSGLKMGLILKLKHTLFYRQMQQDCTVQISMTTLLMVKALGWGMAYIAQSKSKPWAYLIDLND